MMLHFQSQVPGPGTYGKGGIPNAVLEEKEGKSTSNVGMLDSGKSYKRQLPEVVGFPFKVIFDSPSKTRPLLNILHFTIKLMRYNEKHFKFNPPKLKLYNYISNKFIKCQSEIINLIK